MFFSLLNTVFLLELKAKLILINDWGKGNIHVHTYTHGMVTANTQEMLLVDRSKKVWLLLMVVIYLSCTSDTGVVTTDNDDISVFYTYHMYDYH